MKKAARAPRKPSSDKALRLHGTIARDLGVAILSGKYKPGDLLAGEVESSVNLSVSRTAYREAVRILGAKGLVEAKPKVGTKVCAKDSWHVLDPDILAWAFEGDPAQDFLDSLFELRNIVEPAAAALAAKRRSAAHLQAMRSGIEGMARHSLATEEGRLADQEFHAALLHAAGNPFVASLTNAIGAAVTATTAFKQRNQPLPRDPIPDHLHVFEAIAARDEQAALTAMRELIRLAFQDVLSGQGRRANPRPAAESRPSKAVRAGSR